jgi:acyl-CoA reductase-like NAD-dependent aldehyde dehydrogenase
VPAGVVNVISGPGGTAGEELATSPDVGKVAFTGSTEVGRRIMQLGAGTLKKVTLELGGKSPNIILDDANLDTAALGALFGTFMHQGQICMAVKKIVVHERIAAAFTKAFVENVKTLKMGNPRDMGSPIGPIINQRQLDKIIAHVADAVDKGAELLTGGKHEGLYYQPTVLGNVRAGMLVYSEETFGPVAPIVTVASDDEAVAVANDTEYGLSAGIMTRDEERGMSIAHRLETGMAHINDSSINDEPWVPFGGVKNSGLGRHGGKAAIDTFTETRWLTLERGGRKYPPPFVVKK